MFPRTEHSDSRHKFLVLVLAGAIALLGENVLAQAPEIVRIHGVPQSRTAEIVQLGDFWGVGREDDDRDRYLVMALEDEQKRSIERLGFKTEIDRERTVSAARFLSVDREAWERSGQQGIPGFPCYRTVDETRADLGGMASTRPELARWQSIGQTWLAENGQPGGDDISAFVLGRADSPHEQAPLLLMAAQHARELTTAETATRFAEWLFTNYDNDPTARWLLDHREIHIVAQQNPDGRRRVEAGEIWWRKNANHFACPRGTRGVDLNRNSSYFWGQHSSTTTCDQDYRGAQASSEPETRAVQAYMDQHFDKQWPATPGSRVPDDAEGLFISLHSFGQLVLLPWEGSDGGTANNAPNHDQLAWLGRKFGFFTGYAVGRDILYPAGGTMTDQAHGEFGVAAYTFEIGTDFHQSCGYFEQSIWPRMLDSLLYAAKAARRPYQAPSGPDIVAPAARIDGSPGAFRITGRADDSRFDRGGVAEIPATDPIAEPSTIRASFVTPPDQAADPVVMGLSGSGASIDFDFELDIPEGLDLPALLFLQATDSEGHTGVPEAVWLTGPRIFEDEFESAP